VATVMQRVEGVKNFQSRTKILSETDDFHNGNNRLLFVAITVCRRVGRRG